MTKDKDRFRVVDQTSHSRNHLPSFVNQIRENSLAILVNCLDELFSGCDDLFFDLSSRAASNSEQNLYFESMRDLRVKKHGVINRFKQNLEHSFQKLAIADIGAARRAQDDASADNLSIVQNDDLEQEVAISSMISKARANNQEALYQLNTRLDFLIKTVTISEDNNPLDPQQICKQFADACDLLEVGIKARIIIFKQFDRHVVSRLPNVYAATNNLLINAGVMPKISHGVKKSVTADAPQPVNVDNIRPSDIIGESYDFLEISSLLATLRQKLGFQSFLPNYYAYSSNPGPAMPASELVRLLTQLQANAEELTQRNLHEIIQNLLMRNNPTQPQALQQPDEDVINLVSMFFDFVLDDHALPVAMQALISRLQIPILKVAIRSKAFFSSGSHPARKLVNLIASAGIGCDDDDAKDRLYKKVSQVVHEVTEHYVDDDTVFETQYNVLQEFVDREQRNAGLVEKRTSQALEGQARTKLAKERAQNILLEKLNNKTLPDEIMSFLTEQWLQVLIITYLKEGDESPLWLDNVQVVDDLAWACQHHQDTRSIERLERLAPDIMTKVKSGLRAVIDSEDTFKERVELVSRTLKLAQGEVVERRTMSAAEALALGHTPGSGSRSWQEMTAVERQQAKYKALTYQFIKQAEETPVGTWFLYEEQESGKTFRCKLAARISETDSYVFVNRYGFKALEKSRKDVAYDMQRSIAKPLETGLLVDRAMSAILSNLTQYSSKSPSP